MQKMIKKLLGVALFLIPVILVSCPAADDCIKYQDIADIRTGDGIDSVAVKIDGYAVTCATEFSKVIIGSKTHFVELPMKIHIQLFSKDSLLWQNFSFEIPNNSVLTFNRGAKCEGTAFVDSSQTEKFCWSAEEMDGDDRAHCSERDH